MSTIIQLSGQDNGAPSLANLDQEFQEKLKFLKSTPELLNQIMYKRVSEVNFFLQAAGVILIEGTHRSCFEKHCKL